MFCFTGFCRPSLQEDCNSLIGCSESKYDKASVVVGRTVEVFEVLYETKQMTIDESQNKCRGGYDEANKVSNKYLTVMGKSFSSFTYLRL